jgi:hypothetical protein
MTLIPINALTPADVRRLGTNVQTAAAEEHTHLAALNRSLAAHGEALDREPRCTPRPIVIA